MEIPLGERESLTLGEWPISIYTRATPVNNVSRFSTWKEAPPQPLEYSSIQMRLDEGIGMGLEGGVCAAHKAHMAGSKALWS